MRIRWKLFWLLAAISLVPLLLLRVNSQRALSHLAERLSSRVGAHLVAEAKTHLERLVEDHARILAARRQSLVLAAAMQAAAVEAALAAPAADAPKDLSGAVVVLSSAAGPGMGMGMGRRQPPADAAGFTETPGYFRIEPDGERLPLPIDSSRVLLRLPPGSTAANPPPLAAALAALAPTLTRIATLTGPLAHFQTVALTSGLAVVSPAIPDTPRRMDPTQAPWYLAAVTAAAPVWTPPQAEPGTGRVSVAVGSPVHRPDGTVAGATAIFTPLDDLLASVTSPGHMAGDVETLLVQAEPGNDGPPRLLVEAGDVARSPRHGGHGWLVFVTPAPLASPDGDALAAMAANVAAGTSGVERLTYNGRDCLAAYAKTGEGEALLQIAPVAQVLAEAEAVAGDVEGSIRRLYTFGTFIVGAVMLALLFLSLSASRAVTRPILALTAAARRLAAGDFTVRVPATGRDEIAELGRVFNDLAPTLDAHLRLCEAIELASEIQRNLLPATPPAVPGLALAALCRYCDETGGDYYDFLPFDGPKAGRVGLAVGDVTGHGLGAALLMTTARALLRPRAAAPGTPAEVLADVNRELARDTMGTGRFMTLFYMELDPVRRTAAYARAGHDPALRHNPATGQTTELSCRGMILGATGDARYETGHVADLLPGEILLIGSDGLWEARNAKDEMFGKARTRAVLAAAAPDGPEAVCRALMDALDAFRGPIPLADDVTLLAAALTRTANP
ncbi:SpoIIE family protein phosphatase [Desulfovibrio sp. TomC]|uniref:SpoIIE family protein phosphatase n=1 Tax=Desulfovibrio sp. TomC TaxID=1562888 RepID=UPI000573A8F5|nr:SpoIIE family protein phosphatase [Desulfovibrio sp. TomC]KHK02522.1 Serine phosphatase RsbU, regulator of sigma subunit [Desulfovibrio sp. TomC]